MTTRQRDAVEAYLHNHPVVRETWLFPRDERHPDEPMTHMVAYLRFVKAERLAGLPHQKQGGWHYSGVHGRPRGSTYPCKTSWRRAGGVT